MAEQKSEAYAQLLGAYLEQLSIAYGNYINATLAMSDENRSITLSEADMKELYQRIDNCRYWYIQTKIKFDALSHKLEITQTQSVELIDLCKKIETALTPESISKYIVLLSRIYIDNINPEFLNPPSKQIDALGV